MKKSLIFPGILAVLSVILPIGDMGAFAAPWHWHMYLKVDLEEHECVILPDYYCDILGMHGRLSKLPHKLCNHYIY